MKKIILILGLIIVALICTVYFLIKINNRLNTELKIAVNNEKSFELENIDLKNKSIELQYSITQLKYSKDSIIRKMDSIIHELSIKDKNLKAIGYIKSTIQKTDTVIFKDTVFYNVNIDTTIIDKWYKLNFKCTYPNKVIITSKFKSDKYIVFSRKRETIYPPKKFWLFRLFQKKHTVVEVNVVEQNPYIENNKQKFIEIIE